MFTMQAIINFRWECALCLIKLLLQFNFVCNLTQGELCGPCGCCSLWRQRCKKSSCPHGRKVTMGRTVTVLQDTSHKPPFDWKQHNLSLGEWNTKGMPISVFCLEFLCWITSFAPSNLESSFCIYLWTIQGSRFNAKLWVKFGFRAPLRGCANAEYISYSEQPFLQLKNYDTLVFKTTLKVKVDQKEAISRFFACTWLL